MFILNVIVQGTSFDIGNSNLSVNVLEQANPTNNESDSMAFEKKRVKMQHQPDWVKDLKHTVKKAKKLNLSKINLEELPAFLKRAKELKELDINGNRLKVVPLELLVKIRAWKR